ncbi:hypothetical protein EJB05_13560, partial [Eragrostis curvula]
MDGKKQQPQATGTSFVDELFGPKDRRDAKPAAAGGGGFFSTIFPPPSALTHSQMTRKDGSRGVDGGEGKAWQGNGSSGSYAATGTTSESPYFGLTSVHYGCRDYIYSAGHGQQDPRSHSQTIPPPKKEENKQETEVRPADCSDRQSK